MLIHIQTLRENLNEFEFIHSYYIGAGAVDEKHFIYTEPDNDRLRAAIVNVGFALRDLSEMRTDIKIIGIESDIDGKDKQFGGEHDILFSLLVPHDDFAARKMRSVNYEYERYLSRCLQLMMRHDVKIVLQDRNEGVRYSNHFEIKDALPNAYYTHDINIFEI